MSPLALTAVFVLGSQSEPVGELSKGEFLHLLNSYGYKTENSRTIPYAATITDGKTTIAMYTGFGGRKESAIPFVLHASGRMEFDIPRNLSKKQLADWAKAISVGQKRVGRSFGRMLSCCWRAAES